ncbi:MAG: EamA family transporter [Spirochaetota bacterium]
MSLIAAILLSISAFTHAGWNFLGKKSNPSTAFFLVANTAGVLFLSPVITYYWSRIAFVPVRVWVYLIAAGLFLAVYMGALAESYKTIDMSIAYPLIRSIPVIVVMCIAIVMGRHREVGICFFSGIMLAVTGCILLPQKKLLNIFSITKIKEVGFLPLLAGLATAGYTLVDSEALASLRGIKGRPFYPIDATLVYQVLEGISTSVWMVGMVMLKKAERIRLKNILSYHNMSAIVTGLGIYLTYGLALASMNFVQSVAYVSVFRQLSIPIGAVMGIIFLKEKGYLPKILGIIAVFVGLIMVSLT